MTDRKAYNAGKRAGKRDAEREYSYRPARRMPISLTVNAKLNFLCGYTEAFYEIILRRHRDESIGETFKHR